MAWLFLQSYLPCWRKLEIWCRDYLGIGDQIPFHEGIRGGTLWGNWRADKAMPGSERSDSVRRGVGVMKDRWHPFLLVALALTCAGLVNTRQGHVLLRVSAVAAEKLAKQ